MSIPYNLSSWSDVENFFVSSISTSSFYICFLPLLANTRRYIHFVLSLSPLLKDYRGLGYSCSLFLFAFLIVLYWVLSNFVTEALIEGWTKSVNMLAFSLTILVGTSVSRQVLSALETDNYLKIAFFSSFLPLVKLLRFDDSCGGMFFDKNAQVMIHFCTFFVDGMVWFRILVHHKNPFNYIIILLCKSNQEKKAVFFSEVS